MEQSRLEQQKRLGSVFRIYQAPAKAAMVFLSSYRDSTFLKAMTSNQIFTRYLSPSHLIRIYI